MLSAEGDDDARFSEDFPDAAILFIDLADSGKWIEVGPARACCCVRQPEMKSPNASSPMCRRLALKRWPAAELDRVMPRVFGPLTPQGRWCRWTPPLPPPHPGERNLTAVIAPSPLPL